MVRKLGLFSLLSLFLTLGGFAHAATDAEILNSGSSIVICSASDYAITDAKDINAKVSALSKATASLLILSAIASTPDHYLCVGARKAPSGVSANSWVLCSGWTASLEDINSQIAKLSNANGQMQIESMTGTPDHALCAIVSKAAP